MALIPTIPTSFVPHPAASPERQAGPRIMGLFGTLSYLLLILAVVVALGLFFYQRILEAQHEKNTETLAAKAAQVDPSVITGFIRLGDRLTNGKQLLASHVALSGFFALLQSLEPQAVRISSLQVTMANGDTPTQITGSGVAKDFNALAAVSQAFGQDADIKGAIFSKLVINPNNTVSFSFQAGLDPSLTAFSTVAAPAAAPPSASAATTTATTTGAAATTTP